MHFLPIIYSVFSALGPWGVFIMYFLKISKNANSKSQAVKILECSSVAEEY